MHQEIERKFKLTALPQALIDAGQLQVTLEQRIEQTYLAIDDTEEIRVRRIQDLQTKKWSYTHTFKRGHGLVREEFEYTISVNLYDQLTKAAGFIPLTKTRITATYRDELTVELDLYDQLALIVAEVEFSSLQEAEQFVSPAWFGEEISHQKQYSNRRIWSQLQSFNEK